MPVALAPGGRGRGKHRRHLEKGAGGTGSIIPDSWVMTSICPETTLKTHDLLVSHPDGVAERLRTLSPAHCRLALLDLSLLSPLIERPGELAPLLSPAENDLFHQFRSPKRRLEWLGGRLAAKHCLHRLLAPATSLLSFQQYSILPDSHGRPSLESAPSGRPAASVSISHSRGYAAALACQVGSCGIDIQHLTPQLATVAERFARVEELDLIDSRLAPLTRLGLIWTAKEAVKKCLLADYPSFFGMIRLTRVERDREASLWTALCQVSQPAVMTATVRITEIGDHLVACTTGGAHA